MSNTIIEYTVSQRHLSKVLDHYRDWLILKFPNRFLTPAFMETLQTELIEYQKMKSKRETNRVWQVPVKVIGDAKTSNIDVTVEDKNIKLNLIAP